jgi:hypothetical protein
MATVEEILDDIVLRLTKEVFERYGEPGILRVMNRQYKAFNRDMQVLEKQVTFQEVVAPAATNPFDLPSDWGKEFNIVDQNDDPLTYIDADLFDSDEDGTYTIRGSKIEFGSYSAADDIYTVDYYSTGKKLVILDAGGALAADEIDSPEWVNSHELLFYSVVAELEGLNEMELVTFRMTKENLARTHYDKQGSTPARTQPHTTSPKNKYIDDYEYPYTRHV